MDVIGAGPVIDRQLVFPTFQRKPSAGDPVGAAADRGAEERMATQVFVKRIEAKYHVYEMPVRRPGSQGTAEIAP